jgi:outer membrane protein OmpA-like peptidoglycan-associated protein
MKKNEKNFLMPVWSLFCVSAVMIMLTACATMPERNEALERARTAYERAQADPEVSANAPVALYEATQALKKAEQAGDTEEMDHLAYLAERKAQIAIAQAEHKKAEQEIGRLTTEKDKMLLEAREREIGRMKDEAVSLSEQAEKARREAEAKALEIERAKGKAEAEALELEKARKEAETRALEAQMAKMQTEQAVEKKRQLENEIEELKAKQSDRGIVLTLGDILFETGKADLMLGAMRTIDKLAEFLRKHSERKVLVEGHTDSVGGDTYNLGLSQRRADAAKTLLIARGISPERIMTKGYGKLYPIASNATPAGRQQNRRVEIIILEEGVSPEKMLR